MSRSFNLGPHCDQFIDEQLQQGRFGNATEVVRAGLRLLEDHEAKMQKLRALIAEGDADIAAGRLISYASVEEMTNDIIARGQQKLSSD